MCETVPAVRGVALNGGRLAGGGASRFKKPRARHDAEFDRALKLAKPRKRADTEMPSGTVLLDGMAFG